MLAPTPFLGQAYVARSRVLDAQRAINIYPELDKSGKEVGAFFGTPGLPLLTTVGDGPWRGMRVINGTLYGVVGANLYRISTSYTATVVGTLGTSSGPVGMVNNPTQLLVVDGAQAYGYDVVTGDFASIGLPFSSTGPKVCAYQDGFALINEAGTEQWWQSDLNNVFTFNALNFSSADGQPDPIVGMIDLHREVWLLGDTDTEVWINAGNPGFAFQRLQGVFIQYGIAAPYSAAVVNQTILWLSKNTHGQGVVVQAHGYEPIRVSTHAIENAIASYPRIDDAIAYCYQDEGHTFYVLTFPAGDATWVYDATTQLWHERPWFDNGEYHRHRSNCQAFWKGMNVVGDWQNGNLYSLDLNHYSDDTGLNDGRIKRLRSWQATPTGQTTLNKVRYNRLQLMCEPGVGNQLEPGENPQIILRFSDDGGLSFGDEHWCGAGEIGETEHRVIWRRLGSARDRVWEISITDPVKVAWIGALQDAEAGIS